MLPQPEFPLRAELYSADQMERHGTALAASHSVETGRRMRDPLLARLAENEAALNGAGDLLKGAAAASHRIAPAGEWLLDNFYLIEEQVRTARRHLPGTYSRELPHLLNGPSAGLPRVYDIAQEAIAHGDGRVDLESLRRFVAAYQSVAPLKIGELWAIPIMLRLALIENLRRVALRLAAATTARNRAGDWADRMLAIAAQDPKSLILVIADMARSDPPMVSPFVAELARRLRGQSAALALPLTWIEQRLAESGATIEQLVQAETQDQAADQVSMSNSIGSLRVLGATDWREFVETLSVVERALREDPVYGTMDFATRDRYRHAVERLAKARSVPEVEVAREAIARARSGNDERSSHVGYYLLDEGALRPAALGFYLGAVALASGLFAWGLATLARESGVSGGALLLLVLTALVAASQLAVALVNRLAMALVAPHPLPRLDYSKGIPAQSRTLVVVPALLGSARQVEDLLEALEVRFLANRDAHLHFGLLTDFTDAPVETLPEDAALERLAAQGIEALNRSYGEDRFFLFHRPRRWNPGERVWMGYERKRGKQMELNSLLRGGRHGFSRVVGEVSLLQGVKYVITLDADTQLPRDAARELAGAMAHPLNRPRHDERSQRVCEGYAILQPRVAVSLPAGGHSRFARLFGGEPGIDPYTRTVSDVYQDLFGEGSFVGKGIYDVDAFERALAGRFQENRILSHDLLEGCHARSGLLSDVQLYEEHPATYGADMSRRHRWIRGDWQIAHWVFAPLSALSRWKLFDNLRRSVAPAALVLLLIAGWAISSEPALWTLAVLAILLVPPLIGSLQAWRSTGRHAAQAAFALACLPHEAWLAMDAIARTAWRLLIARQRLLEWTPSGEGGRANDLLASFRAMWIGPALAVATAAYLAAARPEALLVAAPVLLLWLASPAIAWWISQPAPRRDEKLSEAQAAFLHATARKTWAFFETFVGPEDNWLPPDNFQEFPAPVVAHRTSPTNMGLALLANLSAYDFGFIDAGRLIERTAQTLATMQRLERFRGHFYNWYDTRTLAPLPPLYVSSVDSGNLAMHLLTLRQGLLEIPGAESLAEQAGELAKTDYAFLYDAERRLLAIGYNVGEGRRDASFYDLLASEARATSFVAVALDELPQESWFALGRLLTSAGGETALLSWSGSMFEYLMPMLVMPSYDDTLLDQTCRAAVARQIDYAGQRGVPWGMSESGYNMVDAGLNYQYRAFGVPGLGLKRGLSEDLVIAPYASALALMVAPAAACANLQRLAAEGMEGRFGFYEAVDFTPSRLPRGQDSVVVRSYMAHHQGMVLLSLAYLLLGRPMQKRFSADPRFQATLLLLQERIPKRAAPELTSAGRFDTHAVSDTAEMPVRVLSESDTFAPEVQLLSNGRYHVMVSHTGGGYSRWKDLAVTRWREDTTCDNWGSFCYVRDMASGAFWSSAHQPTLKRADTYEAIFSEARAEFRRRDHDYETHTEIVVSPEDDIELRRLRITNRGKARRTVEVTSYAEVVLAPPAADALHPAFSNLFVQTEIAAGRQAILCTRRPRSVGEQAPWMFHALAVHGAECGEVSYETDRARFIGRGRTLAAPQAMQDAALSGSQGSVLDPVVAIRRCIHLEPEQSATIDMVSGMGESRVAVLALAG
ncbi:MAG TPA: glucoamylase family protein [Burkholderiales bacterium]|nr:glucoamylase family protein [Burkholderiales bacterium]